MKTAWEIAYEGQNKFGGKVREYFAESLKLAWKGVKTIMDAMKGTEKQVAWANEIRERVIAWNNWTVDNVLNIMPDRYQPFVPGFVEQMKEIENNNEAKFWIDNFKNVKSNNELNDLFAYGNGVDEATEKTKAKKFVFPRMSRNLNDIWMQQNYA